jgi:hypothetical protein
MTPDLFLSAIVALCVLALLVFALIGLMAMADFARFNRRPEDDRPPASWITKQRGDR